MVIPWTTLFNEETRRANETEYQLAEARKQAAQAQAELDSLPSAKEFEARINASLDAYPEWKLLKETYLRIDIPLITRFVYEAARKEAAKFAKEMVK